VRPRSTLRSLLLPVVPVLVLLGLLGPSTPASALPVFARRYKASCSTCHVQYPKLNPFGEAFRRNGYIWPGPAGGGAASDAERQTPPPQTLVAEPYKEVFPYSFWPSTLPAIPPVAFVVGLDVPIFPDAATRPVGERVISFDRLFADLRVLLAAQFGTHVSVYASVSFNTENTFDFQRGFLTIANLVGTYLNIKVGQFEPHILSFNNYRKIGGPDYWIYTRSTELSRWNSTVVRGINFSGTAGGRFGYDLAYVQGVEGSYGTDAIRQVPRDGYGHVYVKIGGLGLDGRDPGGGTSGAGGDAGGGGGGAGIPLRETSLLLGGFFYGGKHDVDTGSPTPEGDLLYKAGGDAYLLWKRFDLLLAAAYERHKFEQSGTRERLQGLAEATFIIFPWLVAGTRYELEASSGMSAHRLTPLVTVHPRINLKTQVWVQLEREYQRNRLSASEIHIAATYAF
jgi:hypothetical protein